MRLLIVDDDPALLKGLSELVERRLPSTAVHVCRSATEALTLLGQERYDLILTDLTMPRVGGLAILDYVRQAKVATPVLLITGQIEEKFEEMARNHGAAALIRKPMDREELLRTIRALAAPLS